MAERKSQWPEVGDLVIATMDKATTYGAYAKLDEYEKQGLLHVSEISVEISAENYKRAEEILQKVSQSAISNVIKAGGQGTFRREK